MEVPDVSRIRRFLLKCDEMQAASLFGTDAADTVERPPRRRVPGGNPSELFERICAGQ
jgi:hypothetical protein